MKTRTATTEPAAGGTSRDNRHYFYYCPNLDLWAVGRTQEEAEARLREEILLLLARCREYLSFGAPLKGNGYPSFEIRPC